ncbi:hypothetical protein GCM10009853_022980 [Glycomyces scopariae]
MTGPDTVVVLTALDLEYTAVLRHLYDVEIRHHKAGTQFQVGTTACGARGRIALGLTGVGNQSAAVIAERAIQEFSPMATLFVGVAGSLWPKPELGDVVVAERVYAYHGGTSEDGGLRARPRAWEAPHAISQLAHQIDRTGEWRRRLPAGSRSINVHFGSIAAGEVVQNSRVSREAMWIRDHYNDAIAVEMEAAGVAHAGHLSGTRVGIVRGVSDRADGTKNTGDDAEWQPVAAANAAAFAVHLAEQLLNEGTGDAMPPNESGPRSGDTVYNFASGQVGIQAARVSGSSVTMSGGGTAPPGDPFALLAALRAQIADDHARGLTDDDDTFKASQDELAAAEDALRGNGGPRASKAVLALKRLGGLVASERAGSLIARAIAAVRELP